MLNKLIKPIIKNSPDLLGGRLEPIVSCDGEKQTQEELTERLFFYEMPNNGFLPNPNLRENFRNRGVFWHRQKRNTK